MALFIFRTCPECRRRVFVENIRCNYCGISLKPRGIIGLIIDKIIDKFELFFVVVLSSIPPLLVIITLETAIDADVTSPRDMPFFAGLFFACSHIILFGLWAFLFFPVAACIVSGKTRWAEWKKEISDDVWKVAKWLAISWAPFTLIGVLLI